MEKTEREFYGIFSYKMSRFMKETAPTIRRTLKKNKKPKYDNKHDRINSPLDRAKLMTIMCKHIWNQSVISVHTEIAKKVCFMLIFKNNKK